MKKMIRAKDPKTGKIYTWSIFIPPNLDQLIKAEGLIKIK